MSAGWLDSSKPLQAACWIILALLFFALRLKNIALQSYWNDEMVSLHFAQEGNWQALCWDNHPPLYLLVLKLQIFLFGNSELSTRSLSVLLSFASFVLLTRFSIKQWGAQSGFILSFLFVLCPAQILMAQEARNYALLELTLLVATLEFFQILSDPDRSFGKWIFLAFLAIGTHWFSLVAMGLQFVFIFWNRISKKTFYLLLAGGAVIVSLIPLYAIDWNFLRWQNQSLQGLSLSDNISTLFLQTEGIFLLLAFAVFKSAQSFNKKTLPLNVTSFNSIFLLIATILLIGGAFVLQKNVFFARYFEFLLVPCLLLLPSTLEFIGSKIYRLAALAFVFIGIFALPSVYQIKKAPWRDLAMYLRQKEKGSVWTSGSTAQVTPYLEAGNIELHKLKEFNEVLKNPGRNWIVEPGLSGLLGITNAQEILKSQNRKFTLREFRTEDSDSLLLLEIEP